MQLGEFTKDTQKQTVHIYFQVDENKNASQQAKILHERLTSRGGLAYFDPKTVAQSQANIEACVSLRDLLLQKGLRVITVTSSHPFVLSDFIDQLNEH